MNMDTGEYDRATFRSCRAATPSEDWRAWGRRDCFVATLLAKTDAAELNATPYALPSSLDTVCGSERRRGELRRSTGTDCVRRCLLCCVDSSKSCFRCAPRIA